MVEKIAEKFNRLSRVHQRHRQTDNRRQTDGSAMAYSKRNVTFTFANKNSSGDEIANVNFFTTISHTRRPTSKYRKRDKPTSFNKLDDR